jgi:holin-like protein
MIRAMTILLVYQLVGEALVMAAHLPVPGPVMGMMFLFVTLWVRGAVPDDVQTTAQGMLRHLSLLFVPAGVGVMVHATVVADAWLWVMVTLVLSVLITLAVTGWTMQLVKGR